MPIGKLDAACYLTQFLNTPPGETEQKCGLTNEGDCALILNGKKWKTELTSHEVCAGKSEVGLCEEFPVHIPSSF